MAAYSAPEWLSLVYTAVVDLNNGLGGGEQLLIEFDKVLAEPEAPLRDTWGSQPTAEQRAIINRYGPPAGAWPPPPKEAAPE